VPRPPDNLPANEVHGSKGLAERYGDAAFLFETGTESDGPMSDGYQALIEQILNADTPEQILTPVEIRQPRDVVGDPLDIFDCRWQRSEFEAGAPMYASLECKLVQTGEPIVVNCGQKPVMAQCVRLKQLGAFPFRAYFRETGRNQHGTPMYRLTMLPQDKGENGTPTATEPPF
jgi:hypothetical protein